MGFSKDHKFYLNKKIPSLMLGIFALGLLIYSQQLRIQNSQLKRQLLAPPPLLKNMTMGYKDVVADSLWIRTIQDFDYCEQEIAKGYCKNNSWLYLMLDTITDLSPSFRMPYAVGGLALTIIITDVDGATKFFEKGVRAYPNDWPILYRAAYHHLYETKDKKRAAELLIQAGKNGAPPWVYSLAGRMYSESGHLELAESLLQQMIAEKQEEQFIKRLRNKIAAIKAEQKNKASSQ